MRTRKYRAWDKENKVFIDGFYIEQNGDIRNIGYSGLGEPHTLLNHRLDIDDYAGVRDMNKVDVYENDIAVVRHVHDGDEYVWNNTKQEGIPFLISWDDKYHCFDFGGSCMSYRAWAYEVIGNIHQNPELIPR